jgi:dCMP deaminase
MTDLVKQGPNPVAQYLRKLEKFYPLVAAVAAMSKDDTKVGAIVFGPRHEVLSVGYNGPPRGVSDGLDRFSKPYKYKFCAHAEENAIAQAGRSLVGATIVVSTLYPCSSCARMIIQSGITQVVSLAGPTNSPKWAEEAEYSKIMFREAGVGVHHVK